MTVQVIKMFDPSTLNKAQYVLYSVPTDAAYVLSNARIRFANSDSIAHSIYAYGVPIGQGPSSSNVFLPPVSLASSSYMDVDVPELGPGGSLIAISDADGAVVVHCLSALLFS